MREENQNPYDPYPDHYKIPHYPGMYPPGYELQQPGHGGRRGVKWGITVGGIILLIPLLLLSFLFLSVVLIGSPYVVRGSSMYPTLKDGDRVFVVPYRGNTTPDRGDIVVLKDVPGSNELLIKRIVAIQGDRVTIGDGKVIVNGQYEYESDQWGLPEIQDFQLSQGMVFVMGDNELHSFDSRTFGPIPYSSVVGKALFIFWPMAEWKRL